MEEMDNLYAKLQVYLMKKDDQFGKLRFLTSRTTNENFKNVQEICDTVGEILKACGIPTGENTSLKDPKCVQTFKYLVLNTNFESQENLGEDPLNGYLVDMCPPLSPFLLIEVLWSLEYEEILARSILHVPLDLAVELIEISKRCVALLDFPRALNFLFLLTVNNYKKLHLIAANGAITTKLEESLEELIIYCQDLMSSYIDVIFMRINEVVSIEKSERHGLIIKAMIKLTQDCLECAENGVSLSDEEINLYKLTFGREPRKLVKENFALHLNELDQELIYNLLKKVTDVDIATYIDWADLEDLSNPTMSLQKSLGIDCYNFIEFIKNHKNSIETNKLISCLQQIASKPEHSGATNANLDLEALRKGLIDGKKECLKGLMERYREWNHEIYVVVRKHYASMDKQDFLNLLEYLTYVMTKEGQEEHKRDVYITVVKALLQQDIKNVYETVVDYILQHDARNTLECSFTEEAFKNFISHNRNLKTATNLRMLLFFLVKNPSKFLTILVKMCIGHPEYSNIMLTPSDFMLVSPILSIREKQEESFILVALRKVCIDNGEWNSKKFSHLLVVLLDECILDVDDLVNKIFIPYLNESSNNLPNINWLMNFLRKVFANLTEKTNFEVLYLTIMKKMSSIRNDTNLRKSSMTQTFALMASSIEHTTGRLLQYSSENAISELVDKVEESVRPLDHYYLHKCTRLLLFKEIGRVNIFNTIRDYERRCFVVLSKIRSCHEIVENREPEKFDFQSSQFQDDYIRHFIITSIEPEYVQFAIEAVISQRDVLHCQDEYLAYEKIVRLTIEAGVLCLEYPGAHSPDALATLFKSLARFTRMLVNLEKISNDKIDQGLLVNFRNLDESIKPTIFSSLYTNAVVEMNNRDSRESDYENLKALVTTLDNFSNKCLEITRNEVTFEGAPSHQARRFKVAFDFIQEVTSPTYVDDNYSSLSKIYNLLSMKQSPDVP
ncbi:uncharacterized protein [Venturia canescens]|uniref:uncharacterized protein n=1 Tax=Venturia canescens TaxID=32260 RepID=UPI001C9BDB77|nr:uncharacterized protein LOC122416223 [Venturia canescens]